MPTFRSTKKILIPSRRYRFLRFLEQFLTPTPSREKAYAELNLFLNPGVERKGALGFVNEFLNPRIRRYGFWKDLSQFFNPEPPRSGWMKIITAFLDAPVYRLQQSRDVTRPRQEEPNFLQRFISGLNEFFNAYTHFADLVEKYDLVIEVPSDSFKDALEKIIFSSRMRIDRLTEQLFEGHITPQQYQARMIAEIKRINIGAAILGMRGIGNVTPQAITDIVRQTFKEIQRLNTFLQNTFGNNLNIPFGPDAGLSARQFRAYALKFANAGRATSTMVQNDLMQSMYGAAIEIGGRLYGRRVSPNDDRTCDDCAAWHEIGYIEVTLTGGPPPPTQDCACAQNCRCYLEWCLSMIAGDCPDDIAY